MTGVSSSAVRIPIAPDAANASAVPRILSLCCLFPNSIQPAQGIFVFRRLRHLSELVDVKVVAPIPLVQYGSRAGDRFLLGRGVASGRLDGNLAIVHPRWFYPPFSGSVAAVWLAVCLYPVLARMRREFAFNVIDAHFGHPEGIAAAILSRALGVPLTITLRGNEPKHSKGRLGRTAMAWALRRTSRVFAVSARLRQFAIDLGASPDRVMVIPNGIDAGVFFPRDRAACRVKHGLPPERPIVLSAGALVERKGHHRVMQAIASLPVGARPLLVIAGGPGPEGAYEEKLRRLAATLGLTDCVRFLGPLAAEPLAEVMSAADLFCLASTNEGWPNVVHESLACGTPVVATDVGAVPEMLGGGAFGHIVPVDDPAALSAAVASALGTTWDRAAISGWGAARSWRQVAAEVLEAMKDVVAENGGLNAGEVDQCVAG